MSESSDIQAAGQHYLVCGSEDCKKNGQFYCNDCHQPMCEQCRDEHLNSPDTKVHEVILYRQRKHQLPVEKCKIHPTRIVDIFCKECKIPLCLKCFKMKEHRGHEFDDLKEIYAEKYALWQSEFSKIQKYFLPTTQGLKKDVEEDATKIKNIMESIRTSMKSEAESLKNLVDEVTSEKIEQTHTMEKSLLEMLKSQETTYDSYIRYLAKMTDEFQVLLSLTNRKLLFSELTLKILTIPETIKPVPPVFTAGQFSKDDLTTLLGRINVPNTDPEIRKIKPMESDFTDMQFTEKQLELFFPFTCTEIREFTVLGVRNACHVSVDKSGTFWVSDNIGNLVQTDLQGNLLQNIKTSGTNQGYHTATQDEGLVYTDKDKKVINRMTPDKKITEFIKTGNWKPISIHSSRINGDILVGMKKNKEAKVTRYNKAGKKKQNIQRDNKERELYSDPLYITENINGDICTSDYNLQAVVVVNKSGHYRFSYTGQGSEFRPYGICTDDLGHILVCDGLLFSGNVYLLNQDGEYLSIIVSPQQEVKPPCGLCVDDENNVYVGKCYSNTVTVYKYLQ